MTATYFIDALNACASDLRHRQVLTAAERIAIANICAGAAKLLEGSKTAPEAAWHDMASAPRDGRKVIALWNAGRFLAFYDVRMGAWCSCATGAQVFPSRWAALPPTPEGNV